MRLWICLLLLACFGCNTPSSNSVLVNDPNSITRFELHTLLDIVQSLSADNSGAAKSVHMFIQALQLPKIVHLLEEAGLDSTRASFLIEENNALYVQIPILFANGITENLKTVFSNYPFTENDYKSHTILASEQITIAIHSDYILIPFQGSIRTIIEEKQNAFKQAALADSLKSSNAFVFSIFKSQSAFVQKILVENLRLPLGNFAGELHALSLRVLPNGIDLNTYSYFKPEETKEISQYTNSVKTKWPALEYTVEQPNFKLAFNGNPQKWAPFLNSLFFRYILAPDIVDLMQTPSWIGRFQIAARVNSISSKGFENSDIMLAYGIDYSEGKSFPDTSELNQVFKQKRVAESIRQIDNRLYIIPNQPITNAQRTDTTSTQIGLQFKIAESSIIIDSVTIEIPSVEFTAFEMQNSVFHTHLYIHTKGIASNGIAALFPFFRNFSSGSAMSVIP